MQEDKADYYKVLMSIAPLARTPMDKKMGKGLEKYARDLERQIDSLTPWRNKFSSLRSRLLKQGVKPGEIAVILSPGDSADNPLFEGAKIIKENG